VILVDANLLLYAHNSSFARHRVAGRWLADVLSGAEPVRLAWLTILAFIRIGTNPRAFESPLSVGEASEIVTSWLSQPCVAILEPTERHWDLLRRLLSQARVRAASVMDAHLAVLAIEHGAVLYTTDRDFQRFPGLKTRNPIAD